MEFLRTHGLLVCHCYRPVLEWLGLWDCYQCRSCGRLVQR
jgi:hypothetical protein